MIAWLAGAGIALLLSLGANAWQWSSARDAAIQSAADLAVATSANTGADDAISRLEASIKTCESTRLADADTARKAANTYQTAITALRVAAAAARAELIERTRVQCANSADKPFCEVLP